MRTRVRCATVGILALGLALVTAPSSGAVAPKSKLSVVQLGDSVASGEGTLYGYSYDRRTSTWIGGNLAATWPGPYPKCHASPAAYGNVVARKLNGTFAQLACSGATFEDGITTPQTEGVLVNTTLRPAQFGNWDTRTNLSAAYDAARPGVVLVTFGADDLQFKRIVEACVLNGYAYSIGLASLECVPTNPGPTIESDFIAFVESGALTAHYRDIAQWIRDRGEAASPARVPKIVFTTYPDPLPPGGAKCPDSNALYPEQITYLSSLVQQANTVVTSTITALDQPGVVVADVSDAFAGHTWCTDDPWAYGLSIYSVFNPTTFLSQAPFHPTPTGQRRIAALVTPVARKALGR
jgi:lysophospholipase L1-like esterase